MNSYRQQLEELTELDLLEIADNYTSAADYIRNVLGTSSKGQYSSIINTKMKEFDIIWSKKPVKYPIIIKVCPVCTIEFDSPNGGKEERFTCGYSCSNTYFRSGNNNGQYVDGNSSYRTTAFTEHGKVCNRCDITDMDVLVVHHIDRDRSNNKSTNLEVLCANCHMKEHKN